MKKIQKSTLAHYDRMIKWAEQRYWRNKTDEYTMEDAIEENWFGDYCPYCIRHFINHCEKCELSRNHSEQTIATSNCCNGLWIKMAQAQTWKTWLKYARLVRQYIVDNG